LFEQPCNPHCCNSQAANIITSVAAQIPFTGRFVAQGMQVALMRWVQSAELSCDRASLLVVQDPRVVVSVIMKLTGLRVPVPVPIIVFCLF